MKNWKHWVFVAVIAIVGIIMGFVACDNSDNSGNNDPKTFTVTFHANGGTPELQLQKIEKNGKVAEPPIFKEYNALYGWYKESNFLTKWNFATDTVTADITLFAKWIEWPLLKKYIITLKDGDLVFMVTYWALPSEEEPAYLAYMKQKIELVVNDTENIEAITATTHLMSKGNFFTIMVVYTGSIYTGIIWDDLNKVFNIHNDFISTASDTDLKVSSIFNAFNAVELNYFNRQPWW